MNISDKQLKPELDHLFASRLQSFEVEAMRARRGLRVAVAVNVFGVGTLLPNNLEHSSRKS